MRIRMLGGLALLVAVLAAPAGAVLAQGYPSKTVRIVVPYPPGGASDALARAIAQRLGESLGQQFIVENKPGGNTLIGAESVAKAAPDGYTLLLTAEATLVTNPSLYAKLPYDPVKDFAPVIALVNVPQGLAVHPSVPANTLAEFIALARSQPGRITYASFGIGSTGHLNMESFQRAAGVQLAEVTYKGAAPALADLVGGHVSAMIVATGLLAPQAQGGKVRVLAAGGAQRSGLLPDVPTFAEGGLAGFAPSSWFALMAPAGTAKDVIARLNAEINRILADPAFRGKNLAPQGLETIGGSPGQLGELMTTETRKWGALVREAKVKLD